MTIRPSRTRSLIVGVLALAGVRALALCELPAPIFAALAAGVLAFAARDVLARGDVLLGRDEHGTWHLARPGRRPFSGRLAEAGYRGALFVVLVLRDDAARAPFAERPRSPSKGGLVRRVDDPSGRALDRLLGRRRHVAVFADSVAPRDFSRLHFELAFASGGDDRDGPSAGR